LSDCFKDPLGGIGDGVMDDFFPLE
jgi:hypothetical protein